MSDRVKQVIWRAGQSALLLVVFWLPWSYGGVYWADKALLVLALAATLACAPFAAGKLASALAPLKLCWALLAAACLLAGWQLTPYAAQCNPTAAVLRGEFADEPTQSLADAPLSLHPPATRRDLALLVAVAAAFALGALYFSTTKSLLLLLAVLAADGAAVATLGLLQRVSSAPWNYGGMAAPVGSQPFGPFISRNNAGGFLCLGLAAAVGLLVWRVRKVIGRKYASSRGGPPSIANFVGDPLFLTATATVILIFAGIIGTLSRGSLLAAAVGATAAMALLAAVTHSTAYFWPIVSGVGLSLVFVFWLGTAEAATARWDQLLATGGAHESRPLLWRECWQVAKTYAASGSGLGTFYYAHAPFQRHPTIGMYRYGENQYVEALVVGGWLGFGLLLAFGARCFAAARELLNNAKNSDEFGVAFGTVALLLMQSVYAVFDFGWYLPALFVPLAVWSGGAVRLALESDRWVLRQRRRRTARAFPSGCDPDFGHAGPGATPGNSGNTGSITLEAPVSQPLAAAPSAVKPPTLRARAVGWGVWMLLAAGLVGAYREISCGAIVEQAERASRPLLDPTTRPAADAVDEALQHQLRAVESCPDDGEARLRRAELLVKRYELATGITGFQLYAATALAERIGNEAQLAEIRRDPAVVAYLQPAWEECRRARDLCPFNYYAHLLGAQLAFLHAPADSDVGHLERAERLAQGRGDWLTLIGQMHLDAARTDAAWRAWRQACVLAPGAAHGIFPAVLAYLSPREALQRVVPAHPETIVRLARDYLNAPHQGSDRKLYFEAALDLLSSARTVAPAFRYLRGVALAELDRLEDAETEVSEALRNQLAQGDWYYELAAIRAALGKRQAADIAYARYALLLGRHARPENAYLEFAAALLRARAVTDPESRQRCGDLYFEVGRPEDAVRLYREAVRADPENAEAYGGLATVLLRSGDLEGAATAAQRAVEIAPANTTWRRLTEDVQQATKRKQQQEDAASVP